MEEEISLSEILTVLKRYTGQIILCSLLGLVITAVYTFFFITPQYQSTSKIVVNQTGMTGQAITNTDIQTNLNLINTYETIIKEPIILEKVISQTKSTLTVKELSDKLTTQTQDNSLVFGVTVTDSDPYMAAKLADAVSETFQDKIGDILEVESVTVLSRALPNETPVSPKTLVNLVIGLILGLITGFGWAFLAEFMDNTIKDSKFIDEQIGWTNLGSISILTAKEIQEMQVEQKLSKPQLNRRSRV